MWHDHSLSLVRWEIRQGEEDGLFVLLILDRISLKDVVCGTAQIIHQRLQRRLQEIRVASRELCRAVLWYPGVCARRSKSRSGG